MGNARARSRAHIANDTSLTDEQEAAVLRFGKAAGWPTGRRSFSNEQRQELLTLGLFREQVQRLESTALPSICWRRERPPSMEEVREKLADFAKLLSRVERLYVTISSSGTAGSAEALSRFYMAQEALGFDPLKPDERDKLHDSLETATKIARRALEDLPQIQRRNQWRSAEFVRLIHKALELGHAERFRCSGYGDTTTEPEPMPPFLIRVTRTRKARRRGRVPPFGEIAHIVSEASGGWSSDDAIREYLKQQRARRFSRKKGGK